MWPLNVQHQFAIAQSSTSEYQLNTWSAPYSKLLFELFRPAQTDFAIFPNKLWASNDKDFIATLEIFWKAYPVFVLHLNGPGGLLVESTRADTDALLRQRLVELAGNFLPAAFYSPSTNFLIILDRCPLSALHGASFFGTSLRFYSIPKAPANLQQQSDIAPTVDNWNHDILTPEGETEFLRIVQFILDECGQLPSRVSSQTVLKRQIFKKRIAL